MDSTPVCNTHEDYKLPVYYLSDNQKIGDIGVGNSALPFIDKLLQEHQICVPRTQGVYLIEFVFSLEYMGLSWLLRHDSNQYSHRQ